MKLWSEAKREDVVTEIIPGVEMLNELIVNKLDWSSYLVHMGEWLNEGLNQYEDAVREHFDDLIYCLYGERYHMEYGRYPELEDAEAYMHLPETQELIRKLTLFTVSMTKEKWPDFRDRICKETGLNPDDYKLDFE